MQPRLARCKVLSVAFSDDGSLVASGSSDKTVRLWEVATQQPRGEPMQGHTGAVFSVAFSPRKGESRLATGGGDCSVRVWREVPGGGWLVLCEMSAIPTALDASAALFSGADLAPRDRVVLAQRGASMKPDQSGKRVTGSRRNRLHKRRAQRREARKRTKKTKASKRSSGKRATCSQSRPTRRRWLRGSRR